jgi:hypothetical protein
MCGAGNTVLADLVDSNVYTEEIKRKYKEFMGAS